MPVQVSESQYATTSELAEMSARVGKIMYDLGVAWAGGGDAQKLMMAAHPLLEPDYETLMLAKIDSEAFFFDGAARHAIDYLTVEELKDAGNRKQLSEALCVVIANVVTGLDNIWKLKRLTTQIAEARIAARLEVGRGLPVDGKAEMEEYEAAARFVAEQMRQQPPRRRPLRNFSIDLG